MPTDWASPERLTIITMLLAVLIAGMRQDWVWGWAYREIKTRADKFEDLALKTLSLAERMTDIVEDARKRGVL